MSDNIADILTFIVLYFALLNYVLRPDATKSKISTLIPCFAPQDVFMLQDVYGCVPELFETL